MNALAFRQFVKTQYQIQHWAGMQKDDALGAWDLGPARMANYAAHLRLRQK